MRKLLIAMLLLVSVSLAPAALARNDGPEHESYDARLEGYNKDLTLPLTGTGFQWFLLIILGGIGLIGLFKDAKRSHLD